MKLKYAFEENLEPSESGCATTFLDINTLKQMPYFLREKITKEQLIYFEMTHFDFKCDTNSISNGFYLTTL